MTLIYVVDTETTGLNGGPEDLVVDVGIVAADLGTGKVSNYFSSVVGYPENMIRKHEKAWVFRNTNLSYRQVLNGPSAYYVMARVAECLAGERVTSYNTEFDFGKFLYNSPWELTDVFVECDCIMSSVWKAFPDLGRKGGYPKLQAAYDLLCPDDPVGIGRQRHRALSDAAMAAHVMCALHRMGKYDGGDA